MSLGAAFGAFAGGFAGGMKAGKEFKGRGIFKDKEPEKLPTTEMGPRMDGQDWSATSGQAASEDSAQPPQASSAAGPSHNPYKTTDPVASDMEPYQRAFLNAVAGGESGGRYDIRYDGGEGSSFDINGAHPRVYVPLKDGRKSSAAGRYQFVYNTWKGLMGADTPMTPENQDRAAWKLAQQDYGARTGRDLGADLQQGGLNNNIMKSLSPTWAAFGANQGRHIATYNDSLGRYVEPPRRASPATVTPAAEAGTATPATAGGGASPSANTQARANLPGALAVLDSAFNAIG